MEKKITTHLMKGLIIGLILVVIGIMLQVFAIYDKWVQWSVLGLFIVAIIWACISFSNEMDNDVTFGSVFVHGFKTAVIVTLIAIASFLITNFVMPEFKEKAMEMARAQMEKNPQMNDETIEKALTFTKKYYILFGVLGSLFSYAFFGAIAALIGAGIAKKNPSSNMPQTP